jgi:hypothetical protein
LDSGKYLATFFYIDEWPGEIISFADSLEPGGFCWEARCTVEVPNGWFNAGELIYIVEVLLVMILAHLQRHMFAGVLVGFDGVHGVESVLTGWMIQDEGVRVEVGDERDQGDVPKVHAGASPSSEDRVCQYHDFGGVRIIEIYFLLVVDGRVAHFSKFAGAEEQVADK